MEQHHRHWWQEGIIYQVLVPSFLDTNGDGIGDLPGLIERLDYVAWLGMRALWLSPVYASPMADLGYDVRDYRVIEPAFGTLEDFDRLIAAAHERQLRIVLDWIPNHTSSEHPWFFEAASSRDNPKRDWYIWRDPKPDGSPPNNWISVFGGSVWQWHEPTGQFYLHTFLDQQPDLNWRNPEVRAEMQDVMRFWLRRGVDGFRIDAADLLVKDDQFRDNPPNPNYDSEKDGPDAALLPEHTRNQPELHDIFAKMRAVVDEFEERILLGEFYLPVEQTVTFYGGRQPELHLPLNLQLAWQQWDAEAIRKSIENYLNLLPEQGWPCWIVATHDWLRVAFRAPGEQPRVAAVLLMALGGTAILYYGEEIGMRGVHIPADRARDPQGYRTGRNRDPERTPMQWNGEQKAGFTTGDPWLPIGEDVGTANVAGQAEDPGSLLTLYRRLIQLRAEHPQLIDGKLDLLSLGPPLLGFRREGRESRFLVVLNFSADPQEVDLQDLGRGKLLLNTFLDREGEPMEGTLHLRGDEAAVILMIGQRPAASATRN